MRTISFKKGKHTVDPVKMGEIFKLRYRDNWYTVIAAPESEYASCDGCVLCDTETCRVPLVDNGDDSICGEAGCVFKPIDEVLENL